VLKKQTVGTMCLALNSERKSFMKRFRYIVWFAAILALIFVALEQASPAQANVTRLILTRRSCGAISAYLTYDGFSEGTPAFYNVVAVDLNGNGVYGEPGEPLQYIKITPGGQSVLVGAQLRFAPVPEGSTISVTAYEVDSAGVPVSKQITPVTYQCKHRPATNTLPENSDIAVPAVSVIAKINRNNITVYSEPRASSTPLGGLGRGDEVNLLARNQRGDWVEFYFKGQKGWIMWQTQVIMLGPYMTLPVLPNAESYTPTPQPPTATPTS
jgi:hypothetical protein